MSKFSQFLYNTAKYGSQSALAYNAEPMDAVALDYSSAVVFYTKPSGTYVKFRVVRNQEAFPQAEFDGAVIYETTISGSAGYPTGVPILDDETFTEAPLVSGRIAYYRAWVQKEIGGDWVPAGDAEALIPKKHSLSLPIDTSYSVPYTPNKDGLVALDSRITLELSTTHERFMSLLPKVLTTTTNSPLDEIQHEYAGDSGADDNSLISTFMSAFSFTVDEILTLARLAYPDFAGHGANASIIELRSHEFNMTRDVEPVTYTQKRLLRNAVDIYKKKGTAYAVSEYVESATAYDTDVTTTANLILSHEDATFDFENWESGNSVGYWATLTGSPTVSVVTDQAPPEVITAIDRRFLASSGTWMGYCAKVVTGGTSASIGLGIQDPVLKGIPVTAGLKYSFSFYAKNSSSANVTAEIKWFDRSGALISSTTGTSTATGTTFTRISLANKEAPTNAVYACLVIKFAVSGTYYLDMVQFEQSTTVTTYYEPRAAFVTVDAALSNDLAVYNRIIRISNEIKDYLPFGGAYYISVNSDTTLFDDLIKGYAL